MADRFVSGWLLDTNVLSELRKGRRCDARVHAWASAAASRECFAARVTIVELRLGIEQAPTATFARELQVWLESDVIAWLGPRILEADEAVLMEWRRLAYSGRKARMTHPEPDLMIAATAIVHGLAVVTRNAAHFERTGARVLNPWIGAAEP